MEGIVRKEYGRVARIELKCTDAQKELWVRTAGGHDMALSVWIRLTLDNATTVAPAKPTSSVKEQPDGTAARPVSGGRVAGAYDGSCSHGGRVGRDGVAGGDEGDRCASCYSVIVDGRWMERKK